MLSELRQVRSGVLVARNPGARRDGKVTIRPIAGTRPRGATPTRDLELAAELLADPKELAEHLMLLDLGRNDVAASPRSDRSR